MFSIELQLSFNLAEASARTFVENLLDIVEDPNYHALALVATRDDLRASVHLISDPPLLGQVARQISKLTGVCLSHNLDSMVQIYRVAEPGRVCHLLGSKFARGRLLVMCADTANDQLAGLIQADPLTPEQTDDLIKAYKFFGVGNDIIHNLSASSHPVISSLPRLHGLRSGPAPCRSDFVQE